MIKYLSAEEVGEYLQVGGDDVRHLLRTGKLYAKKLGGRKGDYLIHPVDVRRAQLMRRTLSAKQDPASPDMFWVEAACSFLKELIDLSGFKPTLVVGVAYGGLVPAACVSSLLKCPLVSLRVSHYADRERLSEVGVGELDCSISSEETVLVVDDIADTGGSLQAVQQVLLATGVSGSSIKFAVLHKRSKCDFEPDWAVSVIDSWVTYPWERHL